jgi:hypothetical protein
VWKRFEIDYRKILGVPHEHNYHFIIRAAFTRMSVVFGAFVLYILALRSPHSWFLPNKHVSPAVAALGTIVLTLWPCDLMPEWKDAAQRYALLRSLAKLLLSPVFAAPFSSTFVADALTSMPKIFSDGLATACLYTTGAIFRVRYDQATHALAGLEGDTCTDKEPRFQAAHFSLSVLPFWIRLMQCLRGYAADREARHLWNALKYCTSITVVVLSFWSTVEAPALKALWFGTACASTLFAYVWDLRMDWGHPALLPPPQPGAPSPPPRRYPRWCFDVAAATNALARLGWAVYISPNQQVVRQHMVLLLGCVELMRRAQWAAFRLEWEQHKLDVKDAMQSAGQASP